MPIDPNTYLAAWNLITESTADAMMEAEGDEERALNIMMKRFHARDDAGRRRRAASAILAFSDALDAVSRPPHPKEALLRERRYLRDCKAAGIDPDTMSRDDARARLDAYAGLEPYRPAPMPRIRNHDRKTP